MVAGFCGEMDRWRSRSRGFRGWSPSYRIELGVGFQEGGMPSEDCVLDRPSLNRNMCLYEGEACDWPGVQVAQLWAEGPPDGGRWELPGQQMAACLSRDESSCILYFWVSIFLNGRCDCIKEKIMRVITSTQTQLMSPIPPQQI